MSKTATDWLSELDGYGEHSKDSDLAVLVTKADIQRIIDDATAAERARWGCRVPSPKPEPKPADALDEQPKWQPMESAKKDGTWIDISVRVHWDGGRRSWRDIFGNSYHPVGGWLPLPEPPKEGA
jgi:hypothetical protein